MEPTVMAVGFGLPFFFALTWDVFFGCGFPWLLFG